MKKWPQKYDFSHFPPRFFFASTQPPEIAPAGLHLAVVAIVDELPQGLEGVVFAFGMVIMLDAVHLDAAVVFGKGTIVLPCLLVGLDGVDDPILIDEMRRVDIRDDGEPGGCHFSCFDEASAAHEVLFAPIAAFASRRKVLYGFSLVNALHGAVYPPETQSHLDGIYVTDHTWTVRFRTVDAQPEVGGLIVVLLVSPIKFLSGMDVKQRGDFHYIGLFTGRKNTTSFVRVGCRKAGTPSATVLPGMVLKVGCVLSSW